MSEQRATEWLRELGAFRPMSPASDFVLVVGKWTNGYYPIEWQQYKNRLMRDINGNPFPENTVEVWRIFGVETKYPLTKDDCERILKSVGQGDKQHK
jgi:hypothetical protein